MFEAALIRLVLALLGARDLRCPRLSAFGYPCLLIGGDFVLSFIRLDAAPSSGWLMYPPLQDHGAGPDIWLLSPSPEPRSGVSPVLKWIFRDVMDFWR
jgi:cytochrome c oxidase subunit 1/cytochrome c oxidase subunit I+III